MSTAAAITARRTVAWYCVRLGAGRPAGLHERQTDVPHGTTRPQRMQRSSESRMWAL